MFKTADADSDPVNISGVQLLEHTVFHETRTWKRSFAGCYYLFHKRPEAECLFVFPEMTLSPITCEQRGLDCLLQMERVRESEDWVYWIPHGHTGIVCRRYILQPAWLEDWAVRREELDGGDGGWSFTGSKNPILKPGSDLSTAVRWELSPQGHTGAERAAGVHGLCMNFQEAFSSVWLLQQVPVQTFHKLRRATLKTSPFPRCWSWQSDFLIY